MEVFCILTHQILFHRGYRNLKALFPLLFTLIFSIQASAQLYTFQNYTHRDGLSMSKINSFEQTEDGYLWIGTDGAALIRFDGTKFDEIQINGNQKNFHFNDLCAKGDDIYIATAYSGFRKFSRSKRTIKQLDSKEIKKGNGDRIIVQESCIYFIGDLGISRYKDGKEKLVKKFKKRLTRPIFQVIETPYGTFATSNEGIFLFKDDEFKQLKNSPLSPALGNLDDFQFGWFNSNNLILYNSTFDQKLIIKFNEDRTIKSIVERPQKKLFEEGEYVVAADFKESQDQRVIITNLGNIFTEKSDSFTRIIHNYLEPFQVPDGIKIGNNGEFWVSSRFSGVFKISIEPFTKVQLSQLFTSPDIGFPFVDNDKVLISLMTTGTHVGEIKQRSTFDYYPIQLNGSCEIKGSTFLATTKGIKKYNPAAKNPFSDFLEDGESISFIYDDGFDIWYSIRGEGPSKYNIVTQKKTTYGSTKVTPAFIYTAQTTFNGDFIYFGTNNGIFKFDKTYKKFSQIPVKNMGSYCGVSAIDAFGNLWFTIDRGIVGIVNGKIIRVDISKFSSSSVSYTLNADKYGNLILGTNKGITILKVNANGKITSFQNYSGGTGFDGYETHMRSQFQIGNNIYIGTIEGLFLINTDILENLTAPIRPIITDISDKSLKESRSFRLKVNNPKISTLYYRYRILELGDKWIDLKKSSYVRLHDLNSGNYTLEVCASHDGIIYSEASSNNFIVDLPLWNSKWFIIIFVLIILLLNILILVYGKHYDSSRLLSTKDTELHVQMAPTTLLFGAIVSTGSHLIGSYFDPTLIMNLGLILTVGFIMFTLYVISLSARNNRLQHWFKYLLAIGIYVILLHFFWELFQSNMHPFHFVGVILTISVAPFLLNRMINTVTFGIVVFLISILCVIFIEDPIYSKLNFMIGIISAIGLLIINTYLRYSSLEKLMFISGIINRGNFPVVAYKADGTITYVSENISQFADITHDELLKNKISFLNTFVPFDDRYKEHDATVEFVEGSKYLIPMADGDQVVRWMEWSYKRFSENTHVIIGQDVSERIELQNTYEMLVQNIEDLIFTVDLNGGFVFMNNTFLSKTGYSKEELIGVNAVSIVPENCREEIDYFYRSHFRERKASSYKELPILTKAGETIWIGQHVNTIYTPGTNNHVKGFISLARDITKVREQQKLMISQRDDITASINYAQRIQFNLLPNEQLFDEHFAHHFIMFSPKDIVSGDFYWMRKIENKLILVLGDCTGHGVPGAFMTLLGINLLNNIILEARHTEPGTILNELDKRLEEYFGTSGKAKMPDGMELTVCVIDDSKEEISYACAGSRFLIHNEEGFTLFKGNTEHIGDRKQSNFKGYLTQYTNLTAKNTLYLFTDGFQDQFGGPKNKKHSFRRMLELFESNVNLSLEDQRMMIEGEFDNWMSNQPQTDDVTVIGVQRK